MKFQTASYCRTLLALFSFAVISSGYAQNNSPRVLGTFIFDNKPYNYEFTKDAVDNFTFNITAASEGERGASGASAGAVPFKEFSQEAFLGIFAEIMQTKYNIDPATIREKSLEVFFKINARLEFIDDEPITAYFILRKDYIRSFLQYNSSTYYDRALSYPTVLHYIPRVEVETEDGALKNITVYAVDPQRVKENNVSPREFLVFKNQFPISLSGKFDYEKFHKINLYCYNCAGIDGLSRFIRLMDLAIFDIVYANDKEDYSPRNLTFSLTPSSAIQELRKEKRSRILEAAAFTDLVGLDREEPNGLLQIEVKRRININTKHRLWVRGSSNLLTRYDLSKTRFIKLSDTESGCNCSAKREKRFVRYAVHQFSTDSDKRFMDRLEERYSPEKIDSVFKSPNLYIAENDDFRRLVNLKPASIDTIAIHARRFKSVYFNFFGYIEPKLLFSKLEQTNRFVDSAKAGGGTMPAIDLYRYQLANFGVSLQAFRLNIPQIKLQLSINGGLAWSRTRVALTADSAGPTVPLNSTIWQVGTTVTFRPDSRWGASMGFEYLLPHIWNNDYIISSKQGLFQDQFDAWLKTGEEGKLFFRFRWTYQNKERNNNFTQVQLGYALNLFAGKNTEAPKQ